MGDNVPKYISTICDQRFDDLNQNIILIGKINGIIYGYMSNKNELFEFIRKEKQEYICYMKEHIFINSMENNILKNLKTNIIRKIDIEKIQGKYGHNTNFYY